MQVAADCGYLLSSREVLWLALSRSWRRCVVPTLLGRLSVLPRRRRSAVPVWRGPALLPLLRLLRRRRAAVHPRRRLLRLLLLLSLLLLLLLQLLLLHPSCSFGISSILCITDDLVRHRELEKRAHGEECCVSVSF
jgi:hypothetical protein